MDAALIREFGVPIAMLVAFFTAIGMGVFVAGKSVTALEKLWADRVDDWKARYNEEHAARVASEQRLDQILPAIASFTALAANIRDELIRGNTRPPARR